MVNRLNVAAALVFCLAAGVGCQSAMTCGDDCGRGCSRAFEKYDCSCDGVCGQCCGADQCGCQDGCAGGDCSGNSCDCDPPLRRMMCKICGCTGCGECYFNEWINDPPALCEPCNR